MSRLARSLLAGLLAVGLAACNGDDDASDASFLEGREMVTVYSQDLPDGFDPDAFVLNLADVFGVEGELAPYQGDDDLSVDIDGRLGEDTGSAALDMQTLTWSFRSGTYEADPACRQCLPSTVSEDDAIARAQELFGATGSLVGDFEWSADRGEVRVQGNEVELTSVRGMRLIDGQPVGSPWIMDFGNGDETLRAHGAAWQPTPLAEVGLLTPDEALAQESAQLANDVPVESVDGAVLAYGTSFDRQAVQGYLVPVYRFPLNADLGLTTEVLAIRRSDLPS